MNSRKVGLKVSSCSAGCSYKLNHCDELKSLHISIGGLVLVFTMFLSQTLNPKELLPVALHGLATLVFEACGWS